MSLTEDKHSVRIGDTLVTVLGETGPISARWRLQLDGRDVAEEKITSGTHTLRAQLPDGTTVEAEVRQRMLGPTKVVLRHEEEVVGEFSGFVA